MGITPVFNVADCSGVHACVNFMFVSVAKVQTKPGRSLEAAQFSACTWGPVSSHHEGHTQTGPILRPHLSKIAHIHPGVPWCRSCWLHELCLVELPSYREGDPGTTVHLLWAQSTAGPGVNTKRKWAKAIKICNPPLNSALCPMVKVYCKLKRLTSEGHVCTSFSKLCEGFLQKGKIPLSRTDFLL